MPYIRTMRLPTPSKLPPGPSPESWTASFKSYSRDPLSYRPQLVRGLWRHRHRALLPLRVYFVSHPEYIEQVLVNHNRKFIKGSNFAEEQAMFGNGLLTSEGDFWLRQRRLAQPAFHRARIVSYADTMVRYADRLGRGVEGRGRTRHPRGDDETDTADRGQDAV